MYSNLRLWQIWFFSIGFLKNWKIAHFIVNFKKLKIQATDWEKVFAEHKSCEEHGSRIYKKLIHSNNKMIIGLMKNMGKEFEKLILERRFTNEK